MTFTEDYTRVTRKIGLKALEVIYDQMIMPDPVYLLDNPIPEDDIYDSAFRDEAEATEGDEWGGELCTPVAIWRDGIKDDGTPKVMVNLYGHTIGSVAYEAQLEDLSYFMWCAIADAVLYKRVKNLIAEQA